MKAKALQFGKAMSAALFVLLLSVVGLKNALAQNLVATLQHGDSISMFYGGNAFAQAHDAAQTGDIITLSSGNFASCDITKAITLRGAGSCLDTITGISPTVFSNYIRAIVPDEEHPLTIEGIWFKSFWFDLLYNPRFIKCNFTSFGYNDYTSQMQNAQFVNCMVCVAGNAFSSNSTVYATNTQFINCYVQIRPYTCASGTNISFLNSIVCFQDDSGEAEFMAANSIFYSKNWYSALNGAGALFNNCVSIGLYSLFNNQVNTNLEIDNFNDVFETYDGSSIDFYNPITERFILKSDFAASFLGNDGTEVGLYGGQAPYNPRPNYMVLKQCNVAAQSTIDNKLSVEIQVVSEGE